MSPRSLSVLLVLPLAACGGGGKAPDGGSDGPGGPIEPPGALAITAPGITRAAPLATAVRVDLVLPASGFEAALFGAATKDAVFAGPPLAAALTEPFAIVEGLAPESHQFFGLGVRASPGPDGEAPYVQAGAVVRVHTDEPIYVDALADPDIADGLTPATAFPDLLTALLTASAQGGGNVLVRAGTYTVGSAALLDDVDLYGGFDAAFDLATRGAEESVVTGGVSGQGMLVVLGQGEPNVIDGLHLDGGAQAAFGIDVSDVDAEVRGCLIERCASRGIRLRNAPGEPAREVLVAGSTSRLNGADGLSLSGAFRLQVEGSRFDSNVQEGLDCDDLIANDGDVAELFVRGCGFFGNGSQGLDGDLAPPAVPGTLGGLFDVRVVDSAFELNGAEGLLIDQDHEGVPGLRAEILVHGVRARANALEGVAVDADAESNVCVHRLASAANGSDGLWISSETNAGIAVVSASALFGNRGAGLRASLGNKPLAASHCVLAFNEEGGIDSETVTSTASSCVFYLQTSPWTGTEVEAEVVIDAALPPPFGNAPEAYALAVAESEGSLTLATDPGAFVGMSAELANDGVEREVVQAGGTLLAVEPPPEAFLVPGAVFLFAAGAPVVEDWAPAAGSPLLGAGLAPAAGPAFDAGPFGAGAGGAPGSLAPTEPEPFRVAATTPPPTAGLGQDEQLRIAFAGGGLDPATLVPGAVEVLGPGGLLAATVVIDAGQVLVAPPGGGWGPGPLSVRVHGVLGAEDGRPLAASVMLFFGTL